MKKFFLKKFFNLKDEGFYALSPGIQAKNLVKEKASTMI